MEHAPNRFWMVHGSGPTNHRHDTYEDAKAQAKRPDRPAGTPQPQGSML